MRFRVLPVRLATLLFPVPKAVSEPTGTEIASSHNVLSPQLLAVSP